MEPQIGLVPFDTVLAFCIATEQRMAVCCQLSGTHFQVPGFVIHSVSLVVHEYAVVSTASPLPWFVVRERYFARPWLMHTENSSPLELFYQVIIHE